MAVADVRHKSNSDFSRRSEWEAAVAFFERERARFCADESLRNKYVAIKDRNGYAIVDVDADKFTLVRRVERQDPNSFTLIACVEPITRTVDVPSVEIRT